MFNQIAQFLVNIFHTHLLGNEYDCYVFTDSLRPIVYVDCTTPFSQGFAQVLGHQPLVV